jgi:hypothetical protein
MLKLFGANPGVAVAIGIGLLILGVASGRYVLAAAGGFVVVGSTVRLLTSRGDRSTRGNRVDWRGPADRR